jgi:hypothetical protein
MDGIAQGDELGDQDALFSFPTPPHFALRQLPLCATASLNRAMGQSANDPTQQDF